MKRFAAIVMMLCLLLQVGGCAFPAGPNPEESTQSALEAMKEQVRGHGTGFADMEYVRPDPDAITQAVAEALTTAENGTVEETMEAVYQVYDLYDWFYTYLSLADIHYFADLTDSYWQEESDYCAENSTQVDVALEDLYYGLAASPLLEELEGDAYFGEGFFDAYQGENRWNEELTAMFEQEANLQSRYYELSEIAISYDYGTAAYYEACGDEMVELLVELIRQRQEIAGYFGYTDYVQFATDFYYYRDYTTEQAESYLKEIQAELVPLYAELCASPTFYVNYYRATEADTYRYVRTMAERMGGTIEKAFQRMDGAGLYDIAYSGNKYAASFEVYLTGYGQPFVFLNPEQSTYDHLSFAHEFGHFCNDYASRGSAAGVDVMEVFSQAMEYLSLYYADGGKLLTQMKLWDSLRLFVEQGAFASFEMAMYRLSGDDLSPEGLRALYAETAERFGFASFGYDDREFIHITHFYTNPMYIMSYLVSNDTALQMYEMERAESGAGLACYESTLDTQCVYFLEFVEEAGLESPFAPGRMARIRETLESGLR